MPHSWIGPAVLAYIFLWTAYSRRKTRYCLTNRRAIIVFDYPIFGKYIQPVPTTAQSEFEVKPGKRTSIFFTKEHQYRGLVKKGGFLWIKDGMEVYKQMQRIQSGAQS